MSYTRNGIFKSQFQQDREQQDKLFLTKAEFKNRQTILESKIGNKKPTDITPEGLEELESVGMNTGPSNR
jgi:hypothetical protein